MHKGASQPAKKKVEMVSVIKEKIKNAQSIYFTDFTNLTVREISVLRQALTQAKVTYFVIKNRLARRALLDSEFGQSFDDPASLAALFTGPTGLALGFGDPIEPGKILKKSEKIKVKGVWLENRVYVGKECEKVVALPSKKTLLTQLVTSMNQPISSLVFVLNQLISSLVYSLEEIRKKKIGGNDVK